MSGAGVSSRLSVLALVWVVSSVLGGLVAPRAAAQSPWLPGAGILRATPVQMFQSYRRYWLHDEQEQEVPTTEQTTAVLQLEYGVRDRLAADVALGYTNVLVGDFGALPNQGLSDTRFGLRYQWIDEFESAHGWMPTLSTRVGAIVAGTYEAGLVESAGDGANGLEGSVLLGKLIDRFALSAELGYRYREGRVPEDLFVSGSAAVTLARLVVLGATFRHTRGLDGPDIGDPGFLFPEVKEVDSIVEGSIGLSDAGGRYFGIFTAQSLSGRNTGQKRIYGAVTSLPWSLRSID